MLYFQMIVLEHSDSQRAQYENVVFVDDVTFTGDNVVLAENNVGALRQPASTV